MKELQALIDISQWYGKDKNLVIAGGGNTSYKNADMLWVKASGTALANITAAGFAVLDRTKLQAMELKDYSLDSDLREAQVKADLTDACITKELRPSVETSLHNVIEGAYVVHLHPTSVNALMCSRLPSESLNEIFGNRALYVPYTDPGFVLFVAVKRALEAYQTQHGKQPEFVFLQNHGIFIGADDTDILQKRYTQVIEAIENKMSQDGISLPKEDALPVSVLTKAILPALRMILSRDTTPILKLTRNVLVDYFTQDEAHFKRISRPFSPDIIVYCKSNYIYISEWKPENLLENLCTKCLDFEKEYGYRPKVILIQDFGMIAVGEHANECQIITDVYNDMIKIAYGAQAFGGEHPMTDEWIQFIDRWEVEQYRRKQSAGVSVGRVTNKIFIITGAAQGFGAGIARCLMQEGAHVVVADINAVQGQLTVDDLNSTARNNRALFVQTDVADPASLSRLMEITVAAFGGVDAYINNAGVVKAGTIEEMSPADFEFVTKINYNAYFYGVQQVTPIFKLQTRYAPARYFDIIQINSKSGLRGSKANFAYAGSKFAGIGLTQSFALELAAFQIKVNAICPGNYYDGPLWSDPEKGLFVQYLKAGKVPGAKTVEEVRAYYLSQSPMRKGCAPEDVVKAIYYLIDQTCETGQALPISGGQVMLN